MLSLPESFRHTITTLHGAVGAHWLQTLPRRIADCERRWQLRVGPPFALSYNYVAPAERADGARFVLKLGVPEPERAWECAALRCYAGAGCARLVEADLDAGALLLERLEPGALLSTVEADTEATSIAAAVMRQLWRPLPSDFSFRPVSEWAAGLQGLRERFEGGTGPLPRALVEQAEALFAELLASSAPPVILHGDLHHENILRASDTVWKAIDPKGMAGEPAFEVYALLLNPMPKLLQFPNPTQVTARRVEQLAEELALEATRIRGWGLAMAVLSAWWSLEDHGEGWEAAIAVAEMLSTLKE